MDRKTIKIAHQRRKINMKNVEVPARLNRVSTKADGSLSIGFETAIEMNPEETMLLIGYVRREGWLLFSMNEFQEADIPKTSAISTEKSPSKRLHNVLYAYWKNSIDIGDFDSWYKKKMESIIESVKEKLPERI
jgi:hypothetical protein